jgi:hypothetical protein
LVQEDLLETQYKVVITPFFQLLHLRAEVKVRIIFIIHKQVTVALAEAAVLLLALQALLELGYQDKDLQAEQNRLLVIQAAEAEAQDKLALQHLREVQGMVAMVLLHLLQAHP